MRTLIILLLVSAGLVLVVVLGVVVLVGTLEAAAVLLAAAVVVFAVGLVIDAFRAPPPTCGLVRRVVFRDTCEGTCPPGQLCTRTATRPYGRIGFLGVQVGVQDAACACVAVAAPGPPGGVPAPGSEGENG